MVLQPIDFTLQTIDFIAGMVDIVNGTLRTAATAAASSSSTAAGGLRLRLRFRFRFRFRFATGTSPWPSGWPFWRRLFDRWLTWRSGAFYLSPIASSSKVLPMLYMARKLDGIFNVLFAAVRLSRFSYVTTSGTLKGSSVDGYTRSTGASGRGFCFATAGTTASPRNVTF